MVFVWNPEQERWIYMGEFVLTPGIGTGEGAASRRWNCGPVNLCFPHKVVCPD